MRYIYHISDVHIKLDNQVNLENAFNKLLGDIRSDGMLVIAGDIFENKTYLNTEEIYIFSKFMNRIEEKKIHTIIIPGNHDYNINSTIDHNYQYLKHQNQI